MIFVYACSSTATEPDLACLRSQQQRRRQSADMGLGTQLAIAVVMQTVGCWGQAAEVGYQYVWQSLDQQLLSCSCST